MPILFIFLAHLVACEILVPRPGIEPMLPAEEPWSLNHCTAREIHHYTHFKDREMKLKAV